MFAESHGGPETGAKLGGCASPGLGLKLPLVQVRVMVWLFDDMLCHLRCNL